MKVRNGFVSNSSSSSFIIYKAPMHQSLIDEMSEDIGAFVQKLIEALDFPVSSFQSEWEKPPLYGWTFEDMEYIFAFETGMDNFPLDELFARAGLPTRDLGYHYGWDLDEENRKAGEDLKKLFEVLRSNNTIGGDE